MDCEPYCRSLSDSAVSALVPQAGRRATGQHGPDASPPSLRSSPVLCALTPSLDGAEQAARTDRGAG